MQNELRLVYTIAMDRDTIVQSYITKSEDDLQTAQELYKAGRYSWCLFIFHLALERLFKAYLIKSDKEILYIHDLVRLAKQTNLQLKEHELDILREITTFNLEARYDDYKLSFYKKATKEYTTIWKRHCEEFYTFLIEKLS